MKKGVVSIIGRPNVGKSTLFNRLIEEKKAIVENIPGITRDRIYGRCEWRGKEFILIDTGGFQPDSREKLIRCVQAQTELAIKESDLILFVVDSKSGIMEADKEAALILRHFRKPIILVANKSESQKSEIESADFYALGLGSPLPISALHGKNIGELMDEILQFLPPFEEKEPSKDSIPVAIVGRPNVGKSTLINSILKEERVVVDESPGTTRDAVDIEIRREEGNFTFIDTAGIKKRAKIKAKLEYYSILRSLEAIERASIVLLVLDSSSGVTEQDKKIAGWTKNAGKGLIILMNKWDLVRNEKKNKPLWERALKKEFYFADFAPFKFISALKREGIENIFSDILRVFNEFQKKISPSILNEVVKEALEFYPPPRRGGKIPQIYTVKQIGICPPSFVFQAKNKSSISSSYHRYLENKLRDSFGFEGTPIKLIFKNKK